MQSDTIGKQEEGKGEIKKETIIKPYVHVDRMTEAKAVHLEVVKQQLNDLPFKLDFIDKIDKLHWIGYKVKRGQVTKYVLCPLLSKFIQHNIKHIFVRSGTKSGILRFVYLNGYYKEVSDIDLKRIIKSCIPLEIQNTKYVYEVFYLLETDVNFAPMEMLNADENIINFENGVLHLDTGELKPHSPDYLSTIRIPCNYNEDVTIPEKQCFDKFMNDITNNNPEIKRMLLQIIGVVLSNVRGYRMKQGLFIVGAGDTGKTVIKNLIISLIGADNYKSLDLKELECRFSKIQLLNKRLVGSNDMSYRPISELETFKKATGGDLIYGEYKGENGIDFIFNGVLWFCCNELPKFRRR